MCLWLPNAFDIHTSFGLNSYFFAVIIIGISYAELHLVLNRIPKDPLQDWNMEESLNKGFYFSTQ
jgi:hypothetical protein